MLRHIMAMDIRPGDVIILPSEQIMVERIAHGSNLLGDLMIKVYREPDGRLAMSLFAHDSVTVEAD